MNPLIVDYFEAETKIVDRIKARMVDLQSVYTPADISDMVESSQSPLAAHVVYSGDRVVPNEAGNGTMSVVMQRWMVVLAVRSAKAQLQHTSEIRAIAGLQIPKLLDALQGWAPVEWMRPLSRVNGPSVGYSSSFAYFPFMFEGRVLT
jgi:hypothetical protein